MEIFSTQYIESTWGIITNLIIIIIFGLVAYNIYAKRWSAKSGKYSTKGYITWSGKIPGGKPPYLISYSYNINKVMYNGVLHVSPFRAEEEIKKNPKGKEIIVYYSDKDHGFSQAYRPPNHHNIIGQSVLQYLIAPLFLINLISAYAYWLISVSK